MAVDFKKLDRLDRIVVITAAITLVSLFLPWWGASSAFGGGSVSGFSSGYGWLGALLIIAAGVYLLLLRSGTAMPKFSWGPGMLVLGASAIGMYFALIAGIVQVLISFRLFKATGEKLPWDEKKAGA